MTQHVWTANAATGRVNTGKKLESNNVIQVH